MWDDTLVWLLKLDVRDTLLAQTVYVSTSSTRNDIVELQPNSMIQKYRDSVIPHLLL
jgi:hypothetical protein